MPVTRNTSRTFLPQEIMKIKELEKTIATVRSGEQPESLATMEQTLRDTVDTARARNRMLAYCGTAQPGKPLEADTSLASPTSSSMLEFCPPSTFDLDDDDDDDTYGSGKVELDYDVVENDQKTFASPQRFEDKRASCCVHGTIYNRNRSPQASPKVFYGVDSASTYGPAKNTSPMFETLSDVMKHVAACR